MIWSSLEKETILIVFLLDLSDIGDWMMFFFLSLFKRVNIAVIFIYDESFSLFLRDLLSILSIVSNFYSLFIFPYFR